MNCERCQIELEDFLYGELTERLAAEVRQHLADCLDCAAERDRLESENALFAEFYEQTAIDPLSESWEAIRAQIAVEPVRVSFGLKSPWWQRMVAWLLAPTLARQAALAVLLIAVSVGATMWWMRRGSGENQIAKVTPSPRVTPQNAEPNPKSTEPTPATTNELANAEPVKSKPQSKREPVPTRQLNDTELLAQQLVRAEREYQSAIKLLDRAVAKRRGEIDPDAFKKYESSLALIDSSIAQSKRALKEFPNDVAAGQFLLAAYARKVELMQEVAMQ
ncbi:MAG: zf-HC2 domain-containing protein [Acidobacteria bacterium]|nr:zf-HC2 domain-containing protein [Acidobacteriota bacterium]